MGGLFCSLGPRTHSEAPSSPIILEDWRQFGQAYREYALAVWGNVSLSGQANSSEYKDRLLFHAGRLGARMGAIEVLKAHAVLLSNLTDAKMEWSRRGGEGTRAMAEHHQQMLNGPDAHSMCDVLGCERDDDRWLAYIHAVDALLDGLAKDMRQRRDSVHLKHSKAFAELHTATETLAFIVK